MKTLVWAFLLLNTAAISSLAEIPLNPTQRLRKLSYHLKGVPPSAADYRALQTVGEESQDAFFVNKTREYQLSPQYRYRMVERLQDLFRFKRPFHLPEEFLSGPDTTGLTELEKTKVIDEFNNVYENIGASYTAADFLFYKLTRGDVSWLELMQAHEFEVPLDQIGHFRPAEYYFYRPVQACQADYPDKYLKNIAGRAAIQDSRIAREFYRQRVQMSCREDDSRVGGAMSSVRFLHRYSNTATNQNRRRAAAVFRIFLCDDMVPTLPEAESTNEEKEKVLKLLARLEGRQAEGSPSVPSGGQGSIRSRHATDPKCLSCHNKLEPMAKVFSSVGTALPFLAAKGAIWFKEGEVVHDYPVMGLGGLGRTLAQLPQAQACQVQHFWRWFVGDDVPLSSQTQADLVKKFKSVDFEANAFVESLVNRPEFYTPPAGTHFKPYSLPQIYSDLATCMECHKNGSTNPAEWESDDFTKLPIGGEAHHLANIQLISDELALDQGGKGATMPPREVAWPNRPGMRKNFLNWICDGAPDRKGQSTIDPKLLSPSPCQEDRSDQ